METLKRYIILITVFLIFTQNLVAQNLVSNPGFEELTHPTKTGVSPLSKYTLWNPEELVKNDSNYNYGIHSLLVFKSLRLTNCWRKFEFPNPRTGNAMAMISPSFFTTGKNITNIKTGDKLQGQLTDTLYSGRLYCVSFYFYYSSLSWDPVEEIAIYFYKDGEFPKTTFDFANLKVEPQLALKDSTLGITGKWHRFSMIYKAQGGEKHFLIGNFIQRIYSDKQEIPAINRVMRAGEHVGQKFKCYNSDFYFLDDFEIIAIGENDQCDN